jgi:hypothetical protein
MVMGYLERPVTMIELLGDFIKTCVSLMCALALSTHRLPKLSALS